LDKHPLQGTAPVNQQFQDYIDIIRDKNAQNKQRFFSVWGDKEKTDATKTA